MFTVLCMHVAQAGALTIFAAAPERHPVKSQRGSRISRGGRWHG